MRSWNQRHMRSDSFIHLRCGPGSTLDIKLVGPGVPVSEGPEPPSWWLLAPWAFSDDLWRSIWEALSKHAMAWSAWFDLVISIGGLVWSAIWTMILIFLMLWGWIPWGMKSCTWSSTPRGFVFFKDASVETTHFVRDAFRPDQESLNLMKAMFQKLEMLGNQDGARRAITLYTLFIHDIYIYTQSHTYIYICQTLQLSFLRHFHAAGIQDKFRPF